MFLATKIIMMLEKHEIEEKSSNFKIITNGTLQACELIDNIVVVVTIE